MVKVFELVVAAFISLLFLSILKEAIFTKSINFPEEKVSYDSQPIAFVFILLLVIVLSLICVCASFIMFKQYFF